MAALWVLYLSVMHIGQLFYGYGWESLLCETTFLAMFFTPLSPTSLRRAGWLWTVPKDRVSRVAKWLVRWLCFRVMFGAGLIKMRGDACWRDLSCLTTHYETQPIPNPLSWYAHNHSPLWLHQAR